MNTVILNTIAEKAIAEKLRGMLASKYATEVSHTTDMNISHCIGCNHCWLKTPGVCALKDDYEQVLKVLVHSENVWLIAETSLGFINSKGKKVMDRILPLLNMGLYFSDGQMRHTLRYGALNVGVIYVGDADSQLLEFWCQRASLNLGGKSLGVYSFDKMEEAICI